MHATVDKFGRIVIPKALRDGFGLGSGAVLKIEPRDDEIVLRPVREEPDLAMEEGVLVFMGEAVGDLSNVISKQRDERFQKVVAWKEQ